MATLSELLVIQRRVLQDNAGVLNDTDLTTALSHAIAEYSRRMPRKNLYDITGDGSTVVFTLPADWVEDWSVIQSVESPPDQEPAYVVREEKYRVVRDIVANETVLRLRFTTAIDNGVVARVQYTAIRQFSQIPAIHVEAVATLGAAVAAEWIATGYAQQTDTTLNVDIADRDTRSREFAARANRLRALFNAEVPGSGPRSYRVVRV